MKGLIICFLMICTFSFAQTNEKEGTIKLKRAVVDSLQISQSSYATMEAPLTIVDQMPQFVGGQKKMMEFIQKNIKYPEAKKKAKISGTCYVVFMIEVDGSISNVRILKGVTNGTGCDMEALRLMNLMPKWVPGKQNGKVVRVASTLLIRFAL